MRNPPIIVRKYMRGQLTISVWYEKPSMKCKVEYGTWRIYLPRYITELRDGLRGVADFEETKRLYKIITMEVNDMLKEYYERYNQSESIIGEDGMMAEQFTFLTPPRIDTRLYQVGGGERRSIDVIENIGNQIHIMAGAYQDRFEPDMEYISKEEFYERDKNGELRRGSVYCILN